ncbi:MAG: hypothetical protein P8013_12555 [Candidatus Sulfobium sp.]|jgi:hypothetical protein
MEATRSSILSFLLVLALGIPVSPAHAASSGTGTPVNVKGKCADCHAGAANDIKASGGRHRNVPCVGCHLGRHGTATQRLQKCNRCHRKTKRAHFRLENCRGCHRNPHTPLNISFGDIKGVCVNCHAEQVEQLRENKSKHTALACSTCHDVHGKVPQCTRCHRPHSAEMAASECRKCHNAHKPRAVTYADDTPSKDCASCHRKAFDLLVSGKTRHKSFACAFCHHQKHKMVPSCRDCHGSPHPEGIMAKFPVCDDCHKIAHDLNNWPETGPVGSQKEARSEKTKNSVRLRTKEGK